MVNKSLVERVREAVTDRCSFISTSYECADILSALAAEEAALRAENRKLRNLLLSLKRYMAIEDTDENGKFAALAFDGSSIGPIGRDNYPVYEFAENVEKWLCERIDKGLAAIDEAQEKRDG